VGQIHRRQRSYRQREQALSRATFLAKAKVA
jgi:hypothetical protein